MRLSILSAPTCHVVQGCGPWANGAHPDLLPILLTERQANGESFPGERIVRLPRRFTRLTPAETRVALGLTSRLPDAAETYSEKLRELLG